MGLSLWATAYRVHTTIAASLCSVHWRVPGGRRLGLEAEAYARRGRLDPRRARGAHTSARDARRLTHVRADRDRAPGRQEQMNIASY